MGAGPGQLLRLFGLVIEVPCVLALFSYNQGRLGDWSKSPIDLGQVLTGGIGVGFLLWFAGIIQARWPRAKSKETERRKSGSDPLDLSL